MFMKIGYGVHGCLSSCPTCKQGCPICHPCDPQKHGTMGVYGKPVDRPVKPQKCDLCGSTAIDHTEMHCQMNRFRHQIKGNDLADEGAKPTQGQLKSAQLTEATQERKEALDDIR